MEFYAHEIMMLTLSAKTFLTISMDRLQLSKVRRSDIGENKYACLLSYNGVYSGRKLPTFHTSLLLPSSGPS